MESEMFSTFNDVGIGKVLEQQRKMEKFVADKAKESPEAASVSGSGINRMTSEQEEGQPRMADGGFEE